MNIVDGIVLLVVAVSAMMGLLRGLVREILGLGAWLGAAAAAIWLFPQAQALLGRSIADPDVAYAVALGVPFLVLLIAFSLVARSIGQAVRRSALSGVDRVLGFLYGLGRGAALVIAAFILAGLYEATDLWPPQVLEARSLPSIYLGAEWVTRRLPENYRPTLTAPPLAQRDRSADAGVKEGTDAARAL